MKFWINKLQYNILVIGAKYGKNVISLALKNSNKVKNIYIQNSSFIYFDYLKKKKLGKESLINFIKKFEIDIVVLAVPPSCQFNYVKKIKKLGIPIIFQKPLAKNKVQINNFKKYLGNEINNYAIDLNFLTSDAFVFLIKKILHKKNFKEITILWEIPSKKRESWKDNYHDGGGIENNFLIHLVSVFVYSFNKIQVNRDSKKNFLCLLLDKKFPLRIYYNYQIKKNNNFNLKVKYTNHEVLMKNTSYHYHSGYEFYRKNNNSQKLIKLKKFNINKNDRVIPFLKIFNNFINYKNGKEKNKFSPKLAFKSHKILDYLIK